VVEEGASVVPVTEPETEAVLDSATEVDGVTDSEEGVPLLANTPDVAGGGTSPLEAGGGGTSPDKAGEAGGIGGASTDDTGGDGES
jgi:hypothetical protein